jgi:hypothetical protein
MQIGPDDQCLALTIVESKRRPRVLRLIEQMRTISTIIYINLTNRNSAVYLSVFV